MDIRPNREYHFKFVHPDAEPIEFPAWGPTPCKARNAAFTALESIIKARQDQDFPTQGWKLEYQRAL